MQKQILTLRIDFSEKNRSITTNPGPESSDAGTQSATNDVLQEWQITRDLSLFKETSVSHLQFGQVIFNIVHLSRMCEIPHPAAPSSCKDPARFIRWTPNGILFHFNIARSLLFSRLFQENEQTIHRFLRNF